MQTPHFMEELIACAYSRILLSDFRNEQEPFVLKLAGNYVRVSYVKSVDPKLVLYYRATPQEFFKKLSQWEYYKPPLERLNAEIPAIVEGVEMVRKYFSKMPCLVTAAEEKACHKWLHALKQENPHLFNRFEYWSNRLDQLQSQLCTELCNQIKLLLPPELRLVFLQIYYRDQEKKCADFLTILGETKSISEEIYQDFLNRSRDQLSAEIILVALEEEFLALKKAAVDLAKRYGYELLAARVASAMVVLEPSEEAFAALEQRLVDIAAIEQEGALCAEIIAEKENIERKIQERAKAEKILRQQVEEDFEAEKETLKIQLGECITQKKQEKMQWEASTSLEKWNKLDEISKEIQSLEEDLSVLARLDFILERLLEAFFPYLVFFLKEGETGYKKEIEKILAYKEVTNKQKVFYLGDYIRAKESGFYHYKDISPITYDYIVRFIDFAYTEILEGWFPRAGQLRVRLPERSPSNPGLFFDSPLIQRMFSLGTPPTSTTPKIMAKPGIGIIPSSPYSSISSPIFQGSKSKLTRSQTLNLGDIMNKKEELPIKSPLSMRESSKLNLSLTPESSTTRIPLKLSLRLDLGNVVKTEAKERRIHSDPPVASAMTSTTPRSSSVPPVRTPRGSVAQAIPQGPHFFNPLSANMSAEDELSNSARVSPH